MTTELLEQEAHRQAILQAMGIDIWLPRQQLPHAAPTPDWLLEWQLPTQQVVTATAQTSEANNQETTEAEPTDAKAQLAQMRQALKKAAAASKSESANPPQEEQKPAAVEQPNVVIPRFNLQLLRSGNCLLLVDLPMGEPFQARDPEYLLLKDILRAAGLNDAPSMLRNAEAIRWPILSKGNLVYEQGAEHARIFIRELLLHECSQQQTSMVWLMGENAVTYANREDEHAEELSLTPLQEQMQCWNLPSLESILRQPLLKPQLWRNMQKHMPRWL